MNNQEPFDFASFQEEAIKGLYSGKPLTGEKGIFAPMLKHFLEQSRQGEMDAHLASERSLGNSNRRNGISTKRVKSSAGEFERSAAAVTNPTRPFSEFRAQYRSQTTSSFN